MSNGDINPKATRLSQAETEPIIPINSEWKYLDTGTRLDRVDWTAIEYNDSEWKSGKAELGYGDGDEGTAVDRGSEPSSKFHTTIYFRKEFQMGESTDKSLLINLLRDDGAAVYLNGRELFRSNMKLGTIRYATYSITRNSSRNSRIFFPYFVEVPKFRTGKNVFAVEVHRGSRSDKDLSFNFAASALDSSGIPVTIDKTSTITVRAKSGETWSAPTTASIIISPSAALKVTELMYNPIDGKLFEFIELKNTTGCSVNLEGITLSGVNFAFEEGTLAPWESGLLIPNDDPAAFIAKYPNAPILGTYGGSLSNSGEEIQLIDPDGQVIYSVNYSDEPPWPNEASGNGSSLELTKNLGNEHDPTNWRASLVPGGTPGDILFLSSELSLTGGRMAIRFLGLPGNTYSLHTSDDLASGKWRKLEKNEFVTKTKVVEFVVSPNDGEGQQFYRVSTP
jgi:hypothetical protein